MQEMELRYWWEYGDEKTRINQVNEKCSLMLWGLEVPICKINFCSTVLRLSELPRSWEKAANCHMHSLRWPIYVFNSVVNIKLSVTLSHRRSTSFFFQKLAPFIRKNSARFPGFLRFMLTWAIFSTTARRVTFPTWGPPHPCKQALKSQTCLMSPVNM